MFQNLFVALCFFFVCLKIKAQTKEPQKNKAEKGVALVKFWDLDHTSTGLRFDALHFI